MAQLATQSQASLPPAGTWAIDPSHSSIEFSVRHLMAARVRGHFTRFSGTVVVGETLEESSVAAEIDAASIDTRSPDRDAHLRSADFLDVEHHPTLTFRSTALRHAGGQEWRIDGELTIRGITRPVTLDATYHGSMRDPWGNERLGAHATTTIDRDEYGLTWNQPLETGGLLLGKKVEIEIDVEAVRS
ncbi:MAG TPA: YceI family protein [Candidatus Dormibacteraeota bacterium]|jgi:polyisoprenoid-binding protein YceI